MVDKETCWLAVLLLPVEAHVDRLLIPRGGSVVQHYPASAPHCRQPTIPKLWSVPSFPTGSKGNQSMSGGEPVGSNFMFISKTYSSLKHLDP